jgi:HAD superfamily hydrolase (TIGR01662 family)
MKRWPPVIDCFSGMSLRAAVERLSPSLLMPRCAAVFFDVDFTLIYPGSGFQASGYQTSCGAHGLTIDPSKFDAAVADAAPLLESRGHVYDHQVFHDYTRRIIEHMGGTGPAVDVVARSIFLEWAEHRHFSLYPDVPGALRALHAMGIRIGLISNPHRCLTSFESHFELDGLISATVSSFDHGFMKPHPSIFRAGLELMQVAASDAVMVGDSLMHDVRGAKLAGMRAILLSRGAPPPMVDEDVTMIRSLGELPGLLGDEVKF